ncbi:hypothetical protein D9613_001275 [Agrocybe pediades]|uniref:Uncharacterized protein n=1 Tax=Agrocybe pediades TaxID=84607 RepID=A0A8H4R6P6_9AGAR|nr:hypothetical protein D9613_001275 [Agrocybe pediades]
MISAGVKGRREDTAIPAPPPPPAFPAIWDTTLPLSHRQECAVFLQTAAPLHLRHVQAYSAADEPAISSRPGLEPETRAKLRVLRLPT